MIEVKNVSKKYKMGKEIVTALNDVNITINDGEFVSIVGPSGSGKSTLMHLVGGLDTPTSGNVYVDGKDISKLKDKYMSKYRNETIGFVFQAFNLENTQTALENVMMPLIFAGVGGRERKEKAKKALEMVGLGDKIKHKPNEMSGGQRQRVSIARALVNEPKIIFADEPTGNLDSKNGELIMNLLKDLNKKGYTIIMVTHNMDEARNSKRVIKIKDGQVQEVSKDEI
ncbi:ABC transporter ATPase [Clostridium pasteurianum DSM 525 = ATCC 6013]|uniref:ABC transporter ATPase n=1 Tax=Clostridium pasteurianum DSM 525 = ATCC 6013 TaxID=1262449 RepID=A0A0H3J2M2_CLOPA|nr:ABC transporter ATP-binding protein [Clostridium pasteurianum]AJA46158.1 ABC transporter ATPase [Clostridium pasteurianum DSM 525 = ATCC 6013]AJA50146.1 ABC transporter ATPase [Clostridium pasteurianum DSM 525 = ATCC 6013]AOZ73618.1 ABC transporter ATP-binding protein [Clostridium pasteurianum DSM 525 = ATCC 6013]AOZ77415.1 ABC transporter ATP-binding protein [Clostridium pasteurianum]ELP57741.1 ABC transporter ATPase [Clostridium pasteurianum DSM 525 = ATCC 6013]